MSPLFGVKDILDATGAVLQGGPGENIFKGVSGEKIQIDQPGDTDLAGQRYWIRIDRVNYSDGSHPDDSGTDRWPAGSDGKGWSLQRTALDEYGNDPVNWHAGMPSPGW